MLAGSGQSACPYDVAAAAIREEVDAAGEIFGFDVLMKKNPSVSAPADAENLPGHVERMRAQGGYQRGQEENECREMNHPVDDYNKKDGLFSYLYG